MAVLDLDAVLATAGELAALPDTWHRIDSVLARQAATTNQIADALTTDPVLAARLLRLANSPMFGLSQQIERLSQAIHLIGTRQLRELALAAVVIDRMGSGPGSPERIEAQVRHNLAAGIFARLVASRRRETNVERFFVAGLLHDLGMLLLDQAVPDQAAACRRLAGERQLPIEVAEREILGFDHAEAGAALMARWRLPPALCEPVAWHHRPAQAPTHRVEAAAIHLAALAVDLLGYSGDAGPSTPLDPRAWELLGLDPADLGDLAMETGNALLPTLAALRGSP